MLLLVNSVVVVISDNTQYLKQEINELEDRHISNLRYLTGLETKYKNNNNNKEINKSLKKK